MFTVDRKIFVVKNFRRGPLPTKIKHTKYLNYTKNLQAKYFIGENIPIYGNIIQLHVSE